MSKEKEYKSIITEDDYEEEEEDAEFHPSDDDDELEDSNDSSESSSDEEEKEAILDGSIHISHNDEGKLVYNGTWYYKSNPSTTNKFRLKSKQDFKSTFNVCNPLLVLDKEKSKRTIWMDGFFFLKEESTLGDATALGEVSNGNDCQKGDCRKVKERDIELTFRRLNEQEDQDKDDDSSLRQLCLSVHGRGCNEFGSFTINGEYIVTKSNDNKLHNKLKCTKCYSDLVRERKQRACSMDSNNNNKDHKHCCTLVPNKQDDQCFDDDDDDDCIIDEEADFDELIALNEEANMTVEELRKRYMGDTDTNTANHNDQIQQSQPVNKKAKTDATTSQQKNHQQESDDDEYGF